MLTSYHLIWFEVCIYQPPCVVASTQAAGMRMNCVFIAHNSIRMIFDYFDGEGCFLLNAYFQRDIKIEAVFRLSPNLLKGR
jgi:hypothetical protein